MKSLIYLTNETASDIVHGAKTFAPATPVLVFRNRTFMVDTDMVEGIAADIRAGNLSGVDFDGNALTADACALAYMEVYYAFALESEKPSFATERNWRKASCEMLLDGLLKQIDAFDFDGAGVTQTRAQVITTAHDTIGLMSCGFLSDALVTLNAVTPATDDDFLSAAMLAKFDALFNSALE